MGEQKLSSGSLSLEYEEINRLLAAFEQQRVLVVGDFMLDRYIWGEAERISPEAPVQVVRVTNETAIPGGAGNVAHNICALLAHTSVAGVIGTDPAGDYLVEFCRKKGIKTEGLLRDKNRPTTEKTRICASAQQVVRFDREHTEPLSLEFEEKLCAYIEANLNQIDGIFISDYNKGTLTPGVLDKILSLCRVRGKSAIVDPKGIDYRKYRNALLITPNAKETASATGIPVKNEQDLERAVDMLRRQVGDCQILVTQGSSGMTLFQAHEKPYHIPARTREVFDVSGAGDTVMAVMGLGLLAGQSAERAAWLANIAAGVVVSKVGTTPITASDLKEALWCELSPTLKKFKDLDMMVRLVSGLHTQGRKIVFTNGCFDLLHAGHIRLLEASKAYGDVLIVALDDDQSVREIKGAHRPILTALERVKIISALDAVDLVTVFPSEKLMTLLESIRPHILTKGANYLEAEVKGREVVERYGGMVRLIPVSDDLSTSGLIDRIVRTNKKPSSQ
jgi:D-beta-D-heptose 7-phosphate kinase / D-beta-D-heptose 1-phosphate adenosyltransferase